MVSKAKLTEAVDKLGYLKAQIADLQQNERYLRDLLKASGIEVIEGHVFRCTVTTAIHKVIDYKYLVADYAIPEQVIAEYTELQERTTVRVTARINAPDYAS